MIFFPKSNPVVLLPKPNQTLTVDNVTITKGHMMKVTCLSHYMSFPVYLKKSFVDGRKLNRKSLKHVK